MIIRKYKGRDLDALRETVVRELGESAVIVNTRKNARPGLMGKLSGNEYEVIAAADDIHEGKVAAEKSSQDDLVDILSEQKNQYLHIRRSIKMLDDKMVDINDKIEELEQREATVILSEEKIIANPGATTKHECLSLLHPNWYKKVLAAAHKEAGANAGPIHFYKALSELIPAADGIAFRKNEGEGADIYALCGPTGVGKTTSLAKLASTAVIRHQLRTALITIDTYRVGACAQLREYAELLGCTLAVVFSAQEMQRKLEDLRDFDLILIDTQGRGPADTEGIAAMNEILKVDEGINTILTLPANVRAEDGVRIFENFSILKPVCALLTKADESHNCDGLSTFCERSQLPLIYVTDGQRVPEDIHPASPPQIAAMMMPGVVSNPYFPLSFSNEETSSHA